MQAFVYTELQLSIPMNEVPWRELNPTLLNQPGLINKTWLSGVGNKSIGGFYVFDTVANAEKFVTEYFPTEAKKLDAAHTTRILDATVVGDASRDMNSVHFGATLGQKPGAYLFTQIEVDLPFSKAPWREINPMIKNQPGFLAKTWLAGLYGRTVGGLYAFDTIENAKAFAINQFPREAANLNAAFTTRVFDANATEEASRGMKSPFYS